jgi:hypothetical protein
MLGDVDLCERFTFSACLSLLYTQLMDC